MEDPLDGPEGSTRPLQRVDRRQVEPSVGSVGDAYDTQSRMMAVCFGSPV